MKILVRGVNWLGDAVMSSIALSQLRKARPDDEIVLLTPEKLAALWSCYPHLNRLLTFSPGQTAASVGSMLRAEHFDLALLFPGSFRAAFEAWCGKIPKRIGYGGQLRNFLLTDLVTRPVGRTRPHRRSVAEIQRRIQAEPTSGKKAGLMKPAADEHSEHHFQHYVRLLAGLGIAPQPGVPELVVPVDLTNRVCQKFKLPGDKPLIAVQAGAEYGPAKRWPVDRFAATAQIIGRSLPVGWMLVGGPGESELARKLETMMDQAGLGQVSNLAGRTDLAELCALLSRCALLLSNDTGPMHVAAALGRPVIALFGSTSPRFTAPLGPHPETLRIFYGAVPCSPCFRRDCPIDFRCMHSIEPAEVAAVALDLLQPTTA